MEWKTETRGQGKKRVIRKWQTRWRQTENLQKRWAYEAAQLTRSLKVGKYCNSICCLFSKCDILKNYGQMNRTCWIPSLNIQSCIRRPLCSTFRFENLCISPKKTCFFNFFKFYKKKIIKAILSNFSMRLLK